MPGPLKLFVVNVLRPGSGKFYEMTFWGCAKMLLLLFRDDSRLLTPLMPGSTEARPLAIFPKVLPALFNADALLVLAAELRSSLLFHWPVMPAAAFKALRVDSQC
jgi:hypothetical protein